METMLFDLATGKMNEAMATAARDRRAAAAAQRSGMLARLLARLAAR